MDSYSSARSTKHESDRDSTTDSPSDRRRAGGGAGSTGATNDSDNSAMDMSQQIQQLLATTGATSQSGALLSPLQFLQSNAGGGSTPGGVSLPWNMMPQYQMMFLAGQGAGGGAEDGHVVLMSDKDGQRAAQQQLLDSAALQLALQQQITAAGDAAMAAQMAGASAEQTQRVRQQQQQQQDMVKPSPPKPPKKPLTPYMMFSKSIWPQVKAANTHLSSVTEIGAIIGSLWRELGNDEKVQYNEQFSKDKVRYDEELRSYLKTNGLHPSDLIKARTKKKDSPRGNAHQAGGMADNKHAAHHPAAPHQQQSPASASRPSAAASAASHSPQVGGGGGYPGDGGAGGQQQRAGSAGGGGSSSAAAATAALPNFSQAWAAGQPMQQLLAQMGLTGQVYANSDGTISVDNANLASLFALQPQLLQQAQVYTDQGQQLKQANKSSDASSVDSKSWYAGGVGGQHPNGSSAPNGPTEDAAAAQYNEYYTVNPQGQLVKHTSPAAAAAATRSSGSADYVTRVAQLEQELVRTQSALLDKSAENERLQQDLGEACRIINEYRQQQQAAAVAATTGDRSGGSSGGRDSTPSTSG